MAADHYGYNCVKMSGPNGVITLHCDFKAATVYVEQILSGIIATEVSCASTSGSVGAGLS